MEQGKDSTMIAEKGESPKRHVKLNENDHHMIVGAVASTSKEVDSQPVIETAPRKKRPRIKRKLNY